MLFIFEDNPDMPISHLLESGTTVKCTFRNSGRCIPSYVRSLSKDTTGIVFLDVNPRNQETINLYEKLFGILKDYENMLLVPIICIEEITLRFFRTVPALSGLMDYESILDTYTHIELQDTSLSVEAAMKTIYKTGTGDYSCLKNRISARYGLFFEINCDSRCPLLGTDYTCPMDGDILSLANKGILLWQQMPIYAGGIHNHSLTSTLSFADAVSAERKAFYSDLCTKLGISITPWLTNLTVYPYASSALVPV